MTTPAARWPILSWLRGYQAAWLPADAVAGVTLAAYAVPVSMAYASLAGVPAQHGIYCYLLGGLAYALLGTSKQLAIGPTSAIALLVGATVGLMAPGDPLLHVGIASLAALAVAVLCGLAWLLRLSGLVTFISATILTGFKAGAALTIGMTQLPKLFGVPGGGQAFIDRAVTLVGQLGDTKLVVFAMGVAAIVLLVAGERFLPHRPIALMVVALFTAIVALTSLDVSVVGSLPSGLPELTAPSIGFREVDGIVPLGLACLMLAYVEGISAARTLADRHGEDVDARQELLALGAANLAVAFFQGFPVAGGLSQSAVNDKSGAKTPLSLVFASLTLAACLLFLTELLANLPNVVLAAIVLVAVRGLIDVPAIKYLWRVSRIEFYVSMVAFVGVLLFGILTGVLLAALAALLTVLASVAHPYVAFLGRIPGAKLFSDVRRHPDNELLPGILVFRVEGPLLYFNVDHVRDVVWERIEATPSLHLVVCDLSNAPMLDVAAGRFLSGLQKELLERGARLRLVGPHAKMRDLLRAEGLEEQVGYLGRHLSIEQAIEEYEQSLESRL